MRFCASVNGIASVGLRSIDIACNWGNCHNMNNTSELKSRLLKQFISEIQYRNRNPRDVKVLQLLDDLSTNPERVFMPQDKLFRCRLVSNGSRIGVEDGFFGFNAKESFVAPSSATKDMRANYKYIPYLYCTNHPYTALLEVRPRMGSIVSVATIEVKEKIALLDFTLHTVPKNMQETKLNLFSDLSYLFSKPVAFEDDTLDYIPTQYIAEYAKNLGYDGIAFESSLTPELRSQDIVTHPELDRYNVVIFNYEKCYPIKSNLVKVEQQYTECSQSDNDIEHMDIHPTILDMYY